MIYEILPKKIYKAKVKNFEAVQSEIANIAKDCEWVYKHPAEWGLMTKLDKDHHSDKDVISDNDMQNIANEIMDAVSVYNPEFELRGAKSWFVKYDTGDFAHVHNHAGGCNAISGVYFHKLGKEGHLFFMDKEDGDCMHITAEEGELILFPSTLLHGITRVEGEKLTLAFDLS
jgi:hypothetical protein